MQRYPIPNRSIAEVRRENISIQVRGDVAWATFDQISPSTGDAFDVPGLQQEVRILEREGDEWKIACCFVLGSSIVFVTSPLLQVDEKAKILWINEAATEQLKHHRGLSNIGGRLHALNRVDDKRLQAAIQWAAGLKAYTDRQTARSLVPVKYGALPILVGDEKSPEVCWIIADGGMILVSFNDEQTTRHRLEAAAVIYGITPAQMRLTQIIVEGGDVVAAARQLGISINTARTQLKRLFKKTGVSNQAALVRTLLSVVSPLA